MRAQASYIDTSIAQVTAPGLFGGFSFRGLKKPKGGDHHSTAQRKEHCKTEFGKKNSEKKFGESETFYRSKFSPATCVTPLAVQTYLSNDDSIFSTSKRNRGVTPTYAGAI